MPSSVSSAIARLKFRAWCVLGSVRPGLWAIAVLRGEGTAITNRKTDVVIEGFPRSGNTFCYVAFSLMQERPLRVAHHVHGPAQLRVAQRYRIPAVLLLREPLGACSSLLLRQPALNAEMVLKAYCRFHEKVWRSRQNLLVMPFEFAVARPDELVMRLNRKFGTEFTSRDWSVEFRAEVEEKVLDMDRRDRSLRPNLGLSLALPGNSDTRVRGRARTRELLCTRNLKDLRMAAQRWHEKFSEYAG